MTTLQFKRRQHDVKTWPEQFQAQLEGDIDFQIRLNDRMYNRGDILRQCEYIPEPDIPHAGKFTGREIKREIVFVINGYGLQPGYVALQLRPLGDVPWETARDLFDRTQVKNCFKKYLEEQTIDIAISVVRQILREYKLPNKQRSNSGDPAVHTTLPATNT